MQAFPLWVVPQAYQSINSSKCYVIVKGMCGYPATVGYGSSTMIRC
ncbi:Uncharacterised protein [Vibrio cholerae]|nr:Uncharacterised protein [Vibrio cholerae]